MSPVVLPFHQDELLSPDDFALPARDDVRYVEASLPDSDQWTRLAVLYDLLATEVASELRGSSHVTVVSGDCLAVLGTLAGAQRAGQDPGLVWFDAHGDVHTLASSTSGYLGGMPLRMALGGDPDKLVEPLGIRPLTEQRAVLVDARDLDPAEVDYLTTAQVRRCEVADVTGEVLPPGPVIVHVDVDVIDCDELPGLRFPVAGGPSCAAVVDAVRRLMATGRVLVLDLALPWWPPTDDTQQRSRARLVVDLLTAGPTTA